MMSDPKDLAGAARRRRNRGLLVVPLVTSLLIFGSAPVQANAEDGYGLIIIEKQTRPQDSRDAFRFIGAVEGTLRDDGQLQQVVPAGLHSVKELMRHHWYLADIICDDRDSWADLENDTAWIRVDRREHVTCTFYNQRAAEIVVKKVTDPPDSDQKFNFTGDLEGQIGHNETISKFVRPGLYETTEEVPQGWNLTAVQCDHRRSWGDVGTASAHYHVRSGEKHTCTFYNEELPPPPPLATATLIVEKQTDPPNSPQLFNFTGDATGDIADDGLIIRSNLTAGTYNVTENLPPDWKLTNLSCDNGNATVDIPNASAQYALADGETVTCTWYNQQNGTIIIEKQTDPDGSPQQFEFEGDLPGFLQDDQNMSGSFEPYQWYQFWELVPHGWRLDDVRCETDFIGNDLGGEPRIWPPDGFAWYLHPGETVRCTFYNVQQARLILEKETRPDGSPVEFNFTGDLWATLSDGESTYWDVDPGLYSTTEEVPEGWHLLSIRCDDGDSIIDLANATVTYNASAGETITCRYFDLQLGKIIAHKVADPEDTNQTFNFRGDLAGEIGHNGTLMKWVFPGRYHVFEQVPDGWNLTAVQCDGQGSYGDTERARAAYRIRSGYVVTCTFYNSEIPPPPEPGNIIIVKNTDPEGAPDQFLFTGDLGGLIGDGESIVALGLPAGLYNVTEHPGNHWKLTDLTCDDDNSVPDPANRSVEIHLEEGETVVCTFNNTQDGKIIIEKQTIPDGSPEVFEFVGALSGNLSDDEMMMQHKRPGHYHVSEIVPHGWDLIDVDCRKVGQPDEPERPPVPREENGAWIRLFAGETVHCVFTNQQLARIIVEKQVRPSGSDQEFTFDGAFDGDIGHGESLYRDVVPGEYSTSELVPEGWALTHIACNDPDTEVDLQGASVTYHAEPGETLRCTFYNVQLGKIIAKKVTVPEESEGEFNFTGALVGTIGHNGTLMEWVLPGTYHVFEETPPDPWTLTSIECDDDNSSGNVTQGLAGYRVRPGEIVTCTFTNELPPPPLSTGVLIVEKFTDPPGSPQQFNFTGDASGDIGHGGVIIRTNLSAGAYNVTENVPQGWKLVDIQCDDGNSTVDIPNATAHYQIEDDETVTCSFYNVQNGTIIIEKQTDPPNATQEFHFTGDMEGWLEDNQNLTGSFEPGHYYFTEVVPHGWRLDRIECDDEPNNGPIYVNSEPMPNTAGVWLDPGETVRCVFYNVQQARLILTKQTRPGDADGQFTFQGDLSTQLSDGQSTIWDVDPGNYSTRERHLDGWRLYDIDCDDGVTIDFANASVTYHAQPGDTLRCTFHNQQLAKMIVRKVLDPEDSNATFRFSGDLSGRIGHNETLMKWVTPGKYHVMEQDHRRWTLDRIECDDEDSLEDVPNRTAGYDLQPGERVTCTFYNSEDPPLE